MSRIPFSRAKLYYAGIATRPVLVPGSQLVKHFPYCLFVGHLGQSQTPMVESTLLSMCDQAFRASSGLSGFSFSGNQALMAYQIEDQCAK